MRILPASDSSLLVEFGNSLDRQFHRRVLALFHVLMAESDPRIRNLHPAYSSLLVDFDPLQLSHAELAERIRSAVNPPGATSPAELQTPHRYSARTITVPVCYEPAFGPDLEDVATHHGISQDDLIRLHTSPTYLVYFLGFSPGFAYLGGLDPKLATPRLATPRQHVAAGAVGIAGEQTGVYPVDSAGGWRLIGRTPLRLFDSAAAQPSLMRPGDHVRFRAISRAEFENTIG